MGDGKSEMSIEEYKASAVSHFNPINFDPAEWIALAKAAGMRYIAITTRHHDAFALWNTNLIK